MALAATLPASAAPEKAAPTQFDLDCVMTHVVKHPRKVGRRQLRIDLVGKRWCEGTCEAVGELVVRDDVLELSIKPTPIGPALDTRAVTISRKTAALKDEHRVTMNDDVVSVDLFTGACRMRPYTNIDRKLF